MGTLYRFGGCSLRHEPKQDRMNMGVATVGRVVWVDCIGFARLVGAAVLGVDLRAWFAGSSLSDDHSVHHNTMRACWFVD